MKLVVDGKDFMVIGYELGLYPISTNFSIVCGNNLDVIKAGFR
jgi:hypothetical protein